MDTRAKAESSEDITSCRGSNSTFGTPGGGVFEHIAPPHIRRCLTPFSPLPPPGLIKSSCNPRFQELVLVTRGAGKGRPCTYLRIYTLFLNPTPLLETPNPFHYSFAGSPYQGVHQVLTMCMCLVGKSQHSGCHFIPTPKPLH